MNKWIRITAFSLLIWTCVPINAFVSAQSSYENLDQRLQSVEEYLQNIPDILQNFSMTLQDSMNSMNADIQNSIQQQVQYSSFRKVLLNPTSTAFQRIDTNAGVFLIAVQKTEEIDGGYRLHLSVGNPNIADYRDFKIRLSWGEEWNPNASISYQQWRNSLTTADYSFKGSLVKGVWSPVSVDVVPSTRRTLGVLECSMEVSSIEMSN
ncbi:MAG: DUF3251 domain-containing protein [Candidatus Omnitrophica bacterium]|nr:DUF3251 domain-containing protein [Candidatus Omnitrophota bacterium]